MAWWYVDEIDHDRKMMGPFDTYEEARRFDDGLDDLFLVELPDCAVLVDYLQYDLHDDTLPAEVVDELDNVLNPSCCRTVPGLYGYTGEDV